MKKSFSVILATLLIATMLLSACGPTETTAPTAAPVVPTVAQVQPTEPLPTQPPPPAAPGITKVNFWHSMAGDIGGKAIPQMVNEFNASQDACYIVYTYQGSYDDSLNKLKAGLQSNDIPTIIQLYDIGTRLMVDLDVIEQARVRAAGADLLQIGAEHLDGPLHLRGRRLLDVFDHVQSPLRTSVPTSSPWRTRRSAPCSWMFITRKGRP